ncbi:MAG: tRNA (adenosine(37)-N6)-dimethylallyltransferase MiaA [Spirochaetaceae bacterium]|jgi:tRNA dimethylallyltransferase|nr:tRNA (adenosine(37)-N6)-dimethylallyltransferase MiaA [Spirochaetaceae bacterium]
MIRAGAGEPVPVLLLFGPTASGKTAVLEQLSSGGGPFPPIEVISADSMQVYRGMDIGTAKPSRELRARLPHHLIDIRDPAEQFNAGEFVRLADEAVRDIARRGKFPVVSGGTGFYLASFVLGLPPAPPSDAAIRLALKAELREKGAGPLRAELATCDPESAARIHENDEYRLLRALEVLRLSGRPLSSFARPLPGGAPRREYRFFIAGLARPREELYRLINERCALMFRSGLPGEVRRLFEAGCRPEDPGMKAIGYREFFVSDPEADGAAEGAGTAGPGRGEAALKPGESRGWRLAGDLAAVEELVARNSRRYAKRQITYFASLPGACWINAGEGAAARLEAELGRFLAIG